MAPNAKSTSKGPQPRVKISKSAKENTTSRVQTRPQPPAMKKSQATVNGFQPLKTSQAPSQRAKDAETTALLARIAAQEGQLFYSIFIRIKWLIFV